jgi:hypothetical protein
MQRRSLSVDTETKPREAKMNDNLGDYERTILYPAWHYLLIAATVVIYVVAELRRAPFKDKAAAGCATVLFCVSLIDSEKTWAGTTTDDPTRLLLEVLIHYFTAPFTNALVLYVLIRNVLGRTCVNAWAYSLLCIVHTPLSAYIRYIAH